MDATPAQIGGALTTAGERQYTMMAMGIRGRLRQPVERILASQGLVLLTETEQLAADLRYRRAIAQLCGCIAAYVLPELEPTEQRVDGIVGLRGTEPAEGCFVLAQLLAALNVPGDVCEFGVAQGLTSAMLAAELVSTDRNLWLYDSFEGLPSPADQDTLIDDPLGLGRIENYAGAMSYSRQLVDDRLRLSGLPMDRSHVIAGFVTDQLDRALLPQVICFAYVDFDFFEGIRAALMLVHERLSVGGNIVVDDYGFLSSGAKAATDGFLDQTNGDYEFELAPDWGGKFCMLRRIA